MRLPLVLRRSEANVTRWCNAWWRAARIMIIRDHTFISALSEHDFDELDGIINAISLFWTYFFALHRLHRRFVAPKSAPEKKRRERTDGWMAVRTEFGLIWRLREPVRGPLKVFL